MDYNTLLDVTAELAYQLAMSGAETFRVEDSVNKIMQTYGIKAEAFAIPNCIHISIEPPNSEPMTRMRRVGFHGNDLDSVEKYSNLSRRICSEKPAPELASQWLQETTAKLRKYPLPAYLAGGFLSACGFCVLFGGSMIDSISSGICGIVIGIVSIIMDRLKSNPFFKTITASFLMALLAYFAHWTNLAHNVDAVIIGALMILVPGLIFTNGMRDIIYGDTNSGINRIVQVFLIAAAIALGTGAAWTAANNFFGAENASITIHHTLLIECIACFVGCYGFTILFNIHGPGGLLCAAGGVLTWLTYRMILHFTGDDILAYFWATVAASVYAEIMARIRKCPAISYLVISAFPLIPGAGVYYSMNHAVHGDMASFASQGIHTVAIAGVMAVGILLTSTLMRMVSVKLAKRT